MAKVAYSASRAIDGNMDQEWASADGEADPCTLGPPAYRLVSTDSDLLDLEGVLCLDPESGTVRGATPPVRRKGRRGCPPR